MDTTQITYVRLRNVAKKDRKIVKHKILTSDLANKTRTIVISLDMEGRKKIV